ncbi:hypothetical protein [Streptomyces coffeae]|uniref:Uncharacterized protein n=1 Tax=Streptomyces coffeae TaxID=621382 RepID=A0ABS1N5E6_9ACTN|nr:hypothetical protein [Streptomyces coffeae]MBL1095299.1 hypothetical protein [Streptomyces coffeae]
MESIGEGPLSDEEFAMLRALLKRYCSEELDQWEALQTATPYGPVYITMSRGLPPDTEPSAYRPI